MSAQSRVLFLEAEIKRLQSEIAALKCCGNCNRTKPVDYTKTCGDDCQWEARHG